MKHKRTVLAAMLLVSVALARAEPRGWLGVYKQDLNGPMQTALNVTHGVLITEVAENSPAAKAGLKAGDVILKVDSEEITSSEDLGRYVGARPDKPAHIEYLRQGKTETMTVQFGTRERQLEFSLEQMPGVVPTIQQMPSAVEFSVEQYLLELRSLRDEINSLQKEIARLRKDLKKLEK